MQTFPIPLKDLLQRIEPRLAKTPTPDPHPDEALVRQYWTPPAAL